MAEAEMLIEPHPKFEVIRDLVVDFNKIKEDITPKAPSVNITVDADKCVKCADCVSLCPVGVYETQKGEIIPTGIEFCCGDTCRQCEIFCQANAITVSLNRGGA
jgi:NAD-dependent dihydropyrimidine dehydrogenase PreA subunit